MTDHKIKSFDEKKADTALPINPDCKTCKEWLQSISNKRIRNRALFNMDRRVEGIYYNSLQDAFFGAFKLETSKEGSKYWSNVIFELCFK